MRHEEKKVAKIVEELTMYFFQSEAQIFIQLLRKVRREKKLYSAPIIRRNTKKVFNI